MSEQYFAKKPGCESRPVAFETECVGVRASFETDAGVFSKGELDEGTRVLLEALPPLHGRRARSGLRLGRGGRAAGKEIPGRFASDGGRERARGGAGREKSLPKRA